MCHSGASWDYTTMRTRRVHCRPSSDICQINKLKGLGECTQQAMLKAGVKWSGHKAWQAQRVTRNDKTTRESHRLLTHTATAKSHNWEEYSIQVGNREKELKWKYRISGTSLMVYGNSGIWYKQNMRTKNPSDFKRIFSSLHIFSRYICLKKPPQYQMPSFTPFWEQDKLHVSSSKHVTVHNAVLLSPGANYWIDLHCIWSGNAAFA